MMSVLVVLLAFLIIVTSYAVGHRHGRTTVLRDRGQIPWGHVDPTLVDGWMCEDHPGRSRRDCETDGCHGAGMPWRIEGKPAIDAFADRVRLEERDRCAHLVLDEQQTALQVDGVRSSRAQSLTRVLNAIESGRNWTARFVNKN